MTSEEWIALITDDKDKKYARAAVIEALEKEREGEVVLGTDKIYSVKVNRMNHNDGPDYIKVVASNELGQLIFRPTKADKEDKKGGE